MRIICSTCASHYEIEADKIPSAGQLVRCSHCRDVWLVRRPSPEDAMPAASLMPSTRVVTGEPDGSELMPAVTTDTVAPPIDFRAAKARLRPWSDRLDTGHNLRGTLGTLAVGLFCLAVATLTLGTRSALVRHVPMMASLFDAVGLPADPQGLTLRGVRSALVSEGGKTVLTLQGEITNPRDETIAVPALTLVVRDAGEAPLYTWTASAPKARLASGETVAFRSRLAAPPSQGKDVRVSFAGL